MFQCRCNEEGTPAEEPWAWETCEGECRRFPPSIRTDQDQNPQLAEFWGFPAAAGNCWCGEFRAGPLQPKYPELLPPPRVLPGAQKGPKT
jgi:hypothetical protein